MTITGEHVTATSGAPSLEAMALGLSRTFRFAGQTLLPWTVADHMNCLARYIRRVHGPFRSRLTLLLLLHDAHESMTGDVPTSFKTPDMKALQKDLDQRIFASLNVALPSESEKVEIRYFDEMALLSEADVLCPRATYDKLVEDRERMSNAIYCDVIAEYLHEDIDGSSAWLQDVQALVHHHARAIQVAI
jgi:5'-deoxynucleotidase YfbR-like HD superfamily hydrolase